MWKTLLYLHSGKLQPRHCRPACRLCWIWAKWLWGKFHCCFSGWEREKNGEKKVIEIKRESWARNTEITERGSWVKVLCVLKSVKIRKLKQKFIFEKKTTKTVTKNYFTIASVDTPLLDFRGDIVLISKLECKVLMLAITCVCKFSNHTAVIFCWNPLSVSKQSILKLARELHNPIVVVIVLTLNYLKLLQGYMRYSVKSLLKCQFSPALKSWISQCFQLPSYLTEIINFYKDSLHLFSVLQACYFSV